MWEMDVIKYTNGIKRLAAQMAAERRGFEVRSQTAQGVPERARLELRRPDQEPLQAVVRTSEAGLLGLRRDSKGGWKPLGTADFVLIAMKSGNRGRRGIEVLAFSKDTVVAALDAALAQLTAADRRPPNEVPVFISVDAYDKANLGHALPGIRKDAIWTETIHADDLAPHVDVEDHDYIEVARRQFAKRNAVDVKRVTVTFSISA